MTISYILETLLIGPLKLVFEILFSIAYESVGHPGMAIIALSMAMNILVLPLYRQADAMQEKSRKVEERLHDGVAHIKKTFSGDERMMILQTYYRQNHYSPLSALNGTVSLLLEIPFFIAAYQFLSHLGLLEGVSFGPIADLSKPDGMIVLGSVRVNFLPILMTAVNVVSSAIYLKGFPAKTKVQLYAMAAFFLVFLYGSPSGLLVYWTLNNVFSLVKNIFYKLKNPRKVLSVLCAALGAGLMVFAVGFYQTESIKRRAFLIPVGMALWVPLLWPTLRKRFPGKGLEEKPDRKVFLVGCLFLTLLMGALIPSTYIAASPQEYLDRNSFYNPIVYIVHTLLLGTGFFLVWMPVFYWLAGNKGKAVFDKLVWCACGLALVNYMFFGRNLGIISSGLQYEDYQGYSGREQIVNLAVMAAGFAALYWFAGKRKRMVGFALLTASIAVAGMSTLNVVRIQESVAGVIQAQSGTEEEPYFRLSKTGKNVVVLMFDRALGIDVPYIFQEKPELKEQFDGFTYYDNTISHGGYTNFGVPALVGGYEYTPVEMNKRDTELLEDKHNEALKVMPRLFRDNGFQVTVSDAPYAGYEWIPDMAIYDEIPGVQTWLTEGKFNERDDSEVQMDNNKRNFFCFGLMKCAPVLAQPTIYDKGFYHNLGTQAGYTEQVWEDASRGSGTDSTFVDNYNVVKNFPRITQVTEKEENTFLFLCNNMTHEPVLLQMPDYTVSQWVDNTAYDAAHWDRFQINGRQMTMTEATQMAHYQTNMLMFLRLGEWMDYLRENGVYDNTRIILASDHGRELQQIEEMSIPDDDIVDLTRYWPLLMVKDFGSQGFTVSHDFMTTADVPVLATDGVIQNPVNPYTGKKLTSDEKTAHPQYIIASDDFQTSDNNGNTFLPARWISVQENVWDKDNWTIYSEKTVLKEHKAP